MHVQVSYGFTFLSGRAQSQKGSTRCNTAQMDEISLASPQQIPQVYGARELDRMHAVMGSMLGWAKRPHVDVVHASAHSKA
jgi:hypothetical protein